MNDLEVLAEAEINPTEDPKKVKKAVENIIWNAEFEMKKNRSRTLLIAKARGTDSLIKFFDLLHRERILNAARKMFFKGLENKCVTFSLNKQVAFIDRVSFSNPAMDSSLGSIKIQIRCDDPQELIEWLTPKSNLKRVKL